MFVLFWETIFFYGHGLPNLLHNSVNKALNGVATIFGFHVSNPTDYGVVEFDSNEMALTIEEKPKNPRSSFAVTGLYFYPNDVVETAKKVKPSSRGELEITSVNQAFLENQLLHVEILGRGFTWLDMGTHENLLEASNFIETIERRQGLKISCIEEIAYKMGFIDKAQLKKLAENLSHNEYGNYLLSL